MKPWLKIIVGLVLGVITGLVVQGQIQLLSLVGKAFIDLLKMLVGLIVFSSLVVGMCHINDPKKLGRIGTRTLIFYVVTTIIAIGIGLIVVYVIRPGAGLQLVAYENAQSNGTSKTLIDFIFSIVPSNPVDSFAKGNILQIIVFAVLFACAITLAKEKARPVLKMMNHWATSWRN